MERALEQADGYRQELHQMLHKLRLADLGAAIDYRLEEGEPAREILRAAAETNCDLIVLGTHGRTGFRRLLLGSVAEQVMRRADCPVLTVNRPVQESVPRSPVGSRAIVPV
jgi:nucleotide-binding universal stress UspA family protein